MVLTRAPRHRIPSSLSAFYSMSFPSLFTLNALSHSDWLSHCSPKIAVLCFQFAWTCLPRSLLLSSKSWSAAFERNSFPLLSSICNLIDCVNFCLQDHEFFCLFSFKLTFPRRALVMFFDHAVGPLDGQFTPMCPLSAIVAMSGFALAFAFAFVSRPSFVLVPMEPVSAPFFPPSIHQKPRP